jgi:hypothetical protein
MIRVFNDHLGRALHATLYTRLAQFCSQITPEVPYEPIVANWLQRLYTGDMNLHILVTLDDQYNITEHALIDIQRVFEHIVIYCHQVAIDKPNTASFDDVMGYLDQLKVDLQAACIVLSMAKNVKAMERRYNYKIMRTTMIKVDSDDENEREEDSEILHFSPMSEGEYNHG